MHAGFEPGRWRLTGNDGVVEDGPDVDVGVTDDGIGEVLCEPVQMRLQLEQLDFLQESVAELREKVPTDFLFRLSSWWLLGTLLSADGGSPRASCLGAISAGSDGELELSRRSCGAAVPGPGTSSTLTSGRSA